MVSHPPHWPTRVATLALPSRETHVTAVVWPSAAGSLLFLAELNLAPPSRHDLATELTDTLARLWHEHEAERGRDLERALEQLLLELNPVLQVHERLWGNPLAPRYHLSLALVRGNRLALSTVGHVNALIVTPTQLTNIIAAAHGARALARPKPTFTQLVSGELAPSEVLLLTTSSLFDYLSPEKLKQLVGGRAPGQGLRELELVVTALPHHPPVGAIALGLAGAAAAEGTQPSIERLLQTKSDTSLLLEPTVWSAVRRLFSRAAPPPVSQPATLAEQPAEAAGLLGSPHRRLRNVLSRLSWLTSRETTKATVAWWLEAKITAWRRLRRTTQVALLLAVAILVAFSQSLVGAGRTKVRTHDSEQYNRLVAAITEQQAAIEAAFIYRDDERARALLVQAEALLAALPRTTSSREQQAEALELGLAAVRARLDRLTELHGLSPWAVLSASASWTALAVNGTTPYAFSAQGGTVLVTAEGKPEPGPPLPRELGTPRAAWSEGANTLVLGKDGALATLDPRNRTATLLAKAPPLTDAAWYEGRLYYLSPTPTAIFRTTRQGASFSAPTRWLRPSQGELEGARSLTVDGAIYVAYPNRVEKFALGLGRDFALQAPNPPLRELALVRTTSEGDYLYLAAPRDRRVLVYDKNGKLVIQFTFPELSELTSIALDGQNRYLYVLGGANLYRLKLTDYVR